MMEHTLEKQRSIRTATLNAANDLYGANSAESSAVAAAWTAVGRN